MGRGAADLRWSSEINPDRPLGGIPGTTEQRKRRRSHEHANQNTACAHGMWLGGSMANVWLHDASVAQRDGTLGAGLHRVPESHQPAEIVVLNSTELCPVLPGLVASTVVIDDGSDSATGQPIIVLDDIPSIQHCGSVSKANAIVLDD